MKRFKTFSEGLSATQKKAKQDGFRDSFAGKTQGDCPSYGNNKATAAAWDEGWSEARSLIAKVEIDVRNGVHRMMQAMDKGESLDDALHQVADKMDMTAKEMDQAEDILLKYRACGK